MLEALIETTACVPAYRTYIRSLDVPAEARAYIERAVREARERKPHLDPACFAFLRDVLLLENPAYVIAGQREARLAFVVRWQQFTGPIVAKGMEDTALYVYHPLLSLNEVGGDPVVTAANSEKDFWDFLRVRGERWPHAMNASTTHDTKRSEDVRARINVLSEIPEAWEARLLRWSEWNAQHKTQVDGQLIPDRNEEYFLYQTLLGAWPLGEADFVGFEKRIQEYTVKAIREAMVHTRWTRPNEGHEKALHDFVAAVLSEDSSPEFVVDIRAFQKTVAYFGMVNGLAQTLLKMIAPGVPDFFQGSELWDLRLVDPDNRGPVDFAKRATMLQELTRPATLDAAETARALSRDWGDGSSKLWLIHRTLAFRREHAALFAGGDFLPAEVRGAAAENVVAFFRRYKNEWVLAVAPRWLAKRALAADPRALPADEKPRDADANWGGETTWNVESWRDTQIVLPHGAPNGWHSVLTGATIATDGSKNSASGSAGERVLAVGELLADFSVGLLHGEQ